MNRSCCFPFFREVIAVFIFVLALPASAFPPAPNFIINGVARDAYGWALKRTDLATVVLKRNGSIIAEAPINETQRPGENFRAQLAMDTEPGDAYRTGAQTAGVVFTVEVRFPTGTLPVAWITADKRTVGQPGGTLFLDFSIGEDSDGDGIPDAWEWWQLGQLGIGPGHSLWSLNTLGRADFDGDGTSDYDEYLAGTFAFLTEETLSLTIVNRAADGTSELRALLVVDKTYRVEASSDLVAWAPVKVRVGGATAELSDSFTATDTREVPFFAPGLPGGEQQFFRLVLLR